MKCISHIRLINNALISEGKTRDIIDLSERYGIPVVVNTDGNAQPGAIIERINKKTGTNTTIPVFIEFLKELVGFLDMYRGTKPCTYAELRITYLHERDNDILEGKTELIAFRDLQKGSIELVPLVKGTCLDIKNPRQQQRITLEDISTIMEQRTIFSLN